MTRTGVARRPDWRANAALALILSLAVALLSPTTTTVAGDLVGVIVRELPGAGDAPERAVSRLGGTVERQLDIIDGFAADVPAAAGPVRAREYGVAAVTPDIAIRLQSTATVLGDETLESSTGNDSLLVTTDVHEPTVIGTVELTNGYAIAASPGDMRLVNATIKADKLHERGVTGHGVDVALIDSGTLPVPGLESVVAGPDLSFESNLNPALEDLDTFGHGTHMAGIIAGSTTGFTGVAPDARLISLKVADATGATDVSQVIAALDWVNKNRNTDGRNIRVVNLSFGTDGNQHYALDPLTYAAEVAWHNGIVVVVSAGNHGSEWGRLANPAIDPFVIAVGATDTQATTTPDDDTIPSWSARGDGTRDPDVVAPGRSIESLRAPGSYIDANFGATGLVNEQIFRGSGTSQAAAVVSGAVALLLADDPSLSPDEVKYKLTASASDLGLAANAQGSGALNVNLAAATRTHHRKATQRFARADGTGSLHASRGTMIVTFEDGSQLTGEMTANGATWAGATWAGATWAGSQWSGATWAGATWAGATWAGATWAGATWAGATWAGASWDGATWAGATWAGATWAGQQWSTAGWNGLRWN